MAVDLVLLVTPSSGARLTSAACALLVCSVWLAIKASSAGYGLEQCPKGRLL